MFTLEGIAAIITALALLWGQYLIYKKMSHVEHNTNSIKDELVAVTKKEAHAAGMLEEKELRKQQSNK